MDITNKKLLYFKGFLFVLAGLLASAVILVEHPSWKLAGLLAVAIFCFARAYYFVFYVIEHYVDGEHRFSGIWSFIRYVLRKRRNQAGAES